MQRPMIFEIAPGAILYVGAGVGTFLEFATLLFSDKSHVTLWH
jgi:hypothetical protein